MDHNLEKIYGIKCGPKLSWIGLMDKDLSPIYSPDTVVDDWFH